MFVTLLTVPNVARIVNVSFATTAPSRISVAMIAAVEAPSATISIGSIDTITSAGTPVTETVALPESAPYVTVTVAVTSWLVKGAVKTA